MLHPLSVMLQIRNLAIYSLVTLIFRDVTVCVTLKIRVVTKKSVLLQHTFRSNFHCSPATACAETLLLLILFRQLFSAVNHNRISSTLCQRFGHHISDYEAG